MKKIIFFIPFIVFTIVFGMLALIDIGSISPIIIVWLALFFISGLTLQNNFYWGSLFGALPAIKLIYIGTKETGQLFNETPIGVIILIYYIICGYFVYKNNKKA